MRRRPSGSGLGRATLVDRTRGVMRTRYAVRRALPLVVPFLSIHEVDPGGRLELVAWVALVLSAGDARQLGDVAEQQHPTVARQVSAAVVHVVLAVAGETG